MVAGRGCPKIELELCGCFHSVSDKVSRRGTKVRMR